MKRAFLGLVLALVSVPALARPDSTGDGTVTLRYGSDGSTKAGVSSETSLSITIEGTEQAVNFVRSLSPLLSLNRLHVRAEGRYRRSNKQNTIENDEARAEIRYDDDDHEFDFKREEPPAELATDKVMQLAWFLSAGRSFALSASGEYLSSDPNQDHNGEALDLMILGVTRMPDGAVREGETYEKSWTGSRSEKGKTARFAFQQKVKVEKVETRNGKTIATLSSVLLGKLDVPESERNKLADEAWTKCEGKARIVLDVDSGRVLSSESQGSVVAYFANTAEDGSKNQVTIRTEVGGKHRLKEGRAEKQFR